MKKTKFIGYLAFLAAGFATMSCSLTGDDEDDPVVDNKPVPGELTISLSKGLIQANGEDATTFLVKKGETLLTEGVAIYDAKTNTQLDLPDMTFTTKKSGEYSFWAAYKGEQSNKVTLKAVDFAVPELPEDSDPSAKSFKKKLLMTQFTGTGCPNCPYMINLIKKVSSDPKYSDKFELAAAHTYNRNDPAFLSESLDQAMKITGYPTVVFDMYMQMAGAQGETAFKKMFDDVYNRDEAKAGISAASYIDGNKLIVRAAVKAAVDGDFRVGAWLLEDGISAKQANGGAKPEPGVNFDIHNRCIRVADSKFSSTNYGGHSLGELHAGGVGEYVFVIELKDGWVRENLSLLLFASVKDKKGLSVTNCINCKLQEKVSYSYSK